MHDVGIVMSFCLLFLACSSLALPYPAAEYNSEIMDKRGWNNFHSGYGKRAWNKNFSGGFGKRNFDYVIHKDFF